MKNIKKSKVIILIAVIIFLIIGIKIFTDSRADKLLDIDAKIIDSSGLLDVEEVTLQAESEDKSGYYIILPDYINEKIVSNYLIEEKSINGDERNNSDVVIDEEELENTVSESNLETTENVDINGEEETNGNNTIQNNTETNTTITENDTDEEDIDEESDDKIDNKIRKKSGEKIYLTNEELENKTIELTVEYDTKEKKVGEETEIFYLKRIEQQVEEKNVTVQGYMPEDSTITVEVVNKDNINELIGEYVSEKATLKIVYDIKIYSDGVEYQPEEYGENVDVFISDMDEIDIDKQKYKVVHIDSDEKTEEIKEVETREDSIEFKTNSFSEYAIILDEATGNTLDLPEVKAPELVMLGSGLTNGADKWDGSVATGFTIGSGTTTDPYLITSCAELAYLASQVNNGTTTYAGQVFQLTRDLNLDNREWTPIGNTENSFKGIFDGAGRTIANATITITGSVPTEEVFSIGFFGSIGNSGTYSIIRNVSFENINIISQVTGSTNTNTRIDKGYCIGLVTGRMYNHSQVSNVKVTNSKIQATGTIYIRTRLFQYYTGGIAGIAINSPTSTTDPGTNGRYRIENCYVSADIDTENISNYYTNNYQYYMYQVQAGGIIGSIRKQQVWPTNCLYKGAIDGNGFIGPIFGGLVNTETTGNNVNNFSAYWNGNQAGNLTMTSYYTDFTVNGTRFTNTVTNGTSTAYMYYGTVSNRYLDGTKGVNKGIYATNITSLETMLNSLSSSVVWMYEDGDLSLVRRLVASVDEVSTNNYNGYVSEDRYNIGSYTYKWYNNGTLDDTNNTTTYTCAPNFEDDQDVIFVAYDGDYYSTMSFVVEKLYIAIEFNVNTSGASVTASLTGTALPYVDVNNDYTYQWYKEDISGESELITGATSLTLNNLEDAYDYRLVATNNNTPALSAENSFTFGDRIVVFVDYQNGSDYRNGMTEATAVETLQRGYQLLDANGSRSKNIIVLMSNYTGTEFLNSETNNYYAKNATITGKYNGKDYESSLRLGEYSGYRHLQAELTLMYLRINGGGSGNSLYLLLRGYSFTVGEGVTMYNYKDAAVNQGLLGGNAPAVHIFAGWLQYDETNLPRNNSEIVIKSGTYGRISLGGTPGTSDGQGQPNSKDFIGTASNPFNVTITVKITNSTTDTTNYDYDINLLTGGSVTGNNYSNIVENIENGTIGRLLGASIGDSEDRPYGWSNPCNTFIGTSTINITGGTIAELYGGCLGRNMGVFDRYGRYQANATGNQCDSYFYGTVNINMSGGTVTTNIYGAGAGGVSGYDANSSDPYKSYGQNIDTSVNINISGGTVTGNVYGGGYGFTEYLNQNTTAPDGGFLYGNSNIIISGRPTISGSIFGAGCGYEAYSTKNQVAGMKGNSYVEINGTPNIGGKIYGAGDGFATRADMAKLTGTSTVKINTDLSIEVYGGGNNAKLVGNPTINIVQGTHTANIYGGGNNGIVEGNTTVNINGGTNTAVFGGGNNATVENTTVNINDGTNTTVYGGGNLAEAVETTVILNNGTTTTIYGGGNQADVTTTNVSLLGGTNATTFGGGNSAGADETNVTCNGTTFSNLVEDETASGEGTGTGEGGEGTGTGEGGEGTGTGEGDEEPQYKNIASVYGGSNSSGTVKESNVTFTSGTLPYLYGGNNEGGNTETSNVTVTAGTITDVYGGGYQAETDTSNITINNGTITNVYGGGNKATTDTTNVTIANGTITNAYGGGNLAAVTTSNIDVNGGNTTLVFGGGNNAGATTANVTVDGGNVLNSTFGGSNSGGTVTTTNVEVKSGQSLIVYGGNNLGGSATTTNVTITGGTIQDVYGGGNEAPTTNTNVNISSDITRNVYGGGKQAAVLEDTNVTITGNVVDGNVQVTTIGDNVYGGGDLGVVSGNTNVHIKNCALQNSVYAGGNGAAAVVEGNTNLLMEGTANTVTNSVFGGGNQAATGIAPAEPAEGEGEGEEEGEDTTSTSVSTVKIVGGKIGKNVYGGANTSVVYGRTDVFIGYDAVGDTSLEKGDIVINGTVFGGGEANASGSPTYDFSFISVTQGIDIYIDGNGHNELSIKGSIFGSGNASSARGESNIIIQNYGTTISPQSNVSIQRANHVKIVNSALSLSGAIDNTNLHNDVKFSLSRIDRLDLINNSTLYLISGANLLQELNSLYDANGVFVDGDTKGFVTIDPETGETTDSNVDNRIYMLENLNLFVTTNQNNTAYGPVHGMFFFGMFTSKTSPATSTGFYHYANQNGQEITNAGTFSGNSYVKAEHLTNHDTTVDGFYSNFRAEKDENDNYKDNLIHVKYIETTPKDDVYYIWLIGEALDVTVIPITLTASKFATLGTLELQLQGFSTPNTSFTMFGFSSELNDGISLVRPNAIESIELDPNKVDSVFGLSMRTGNTGWATSGTTTFLTEDGGTYEGKYDYKKDNSSFTPALNFCFYHSQNLTLNQDLGKVIIRMFVSIPIDDFTERHIYLDIEVTMLARLYQEDFYEGAITPGEEFGLFTTTDTDITSKSMFSSYFSLFISNAIKDDATLQEGEENKYRDYATFKRAIISRNGQDEPYVLPENTKITMLDMVTNKYYYYIVSANDVTNNKYVYYLTEFTAMGTTDGVFDESAANATYYNSAQNLIYENFIFHTSFADSTLNSNITSNSLLMELRNNENETIVSVLGEQRDSLRYSVYNNEDATIELSGNLSPSTLYLGNILNINAETEFTQTVTGSKNIFDTQYFDKKLGIKISIYDSNGNRLNSDSLFGVNFELDRKTYYPRIDGTTRINIADKVTDVLAKLKMHTENNTIIPTGDYIIRIESFGSPDGIYYGLEASDTLDLNVRIINSAYGLKVSTPDEHKIVNKVTGKTKLDNNTITSTIEYTSVLAEPKISVALYRRDYSSIYSQNYTLMNLANYVTDTLTPTDVANEYEVTDEPTETITHELHLKENLSSGTYKIVYKLYDGENYVGEAFDYIVIK